LSEGCLVLARDASQLVIAGTPRVRCRSGWATSEPRTHVGSPGWEADFQGSGPGACEGSVVSTLILPGGHVTTNGVVSAPDDDGASGIEVDVNGFQQFVTHTDAHGFYAFPKSADADERPQF
jgi:hypothetical protein